ncbi:MAG: bifunctional 5,10-methylenetetrahydrofolate dehydrogenase/5,10-methenyltetrahydrofolate cyclohydrolase [Parcubacteria group bacterium]
MEKIDGKAIAEEVYTRIGDRTGDGLKLVVVMAGDDPATESFVAQKKKAALRTGINFEVVKFSEEAETEKLVESVKRASENHEITAVIVQLPLPQKIDKARVLKAIEPTKDVDSLNGGKIPAPAAQVVKEILRYLNKDISLFDFAVVGYGILVGKPVYEFLLPRAKSVRIFERSDDLADVAKADVIISGTGVPGLISPHMVRDGAIVIDFGYGMKDGKVGGDFDPQISDKNIFYTPTPGGTGPILVAELFLNIVLLGRSGDSLNL